jgi:hypothetical protein
MILTMSHWSSGLTCLLPAHDSHHVSLVQWTNLFASRHKGHRFKSPGGYLCETGILLLTLSRYRFVVKKSLHFIFKYLLTLRLTQQCFVHYMND